MATWIPHTYEFSVPLLGSVPVDRLAGSGRIETAIATSKAGFDGGLAAAGDDLPAASRRYLQAHTGEVVAVGGPAAAAVPAATAVVGRDRYETALALARRFFPATPALVGVASGEAFPDVLRPERISPRSGRRCC